ncbi:MAG: DUF2170 family protein [Pseudomonadales bacterium]|jgi:hypothetical protein|nr:hypothetical protein [Gammaproteobacteria bacterium]MDP7577344.1 DUF2170 family protein [Pseudomonadales bacterium]HJP50677.1 DUF2170 family protein [Pseudomonadales bacterium]|tara:strand:+ start:285 stop:692 length:408 start_codon:yes stop_codon:yes gene_type:complete
MNTRDLALRISDLSSFEGYEFDCQPIPGDTEVLQITLREFEELPSFVSVTDTQILCITYLFTEDEVKPESRTELLEEMLELNIPMPLSSFAKLGDRYVVFGALAVNSDIEDICHEIITLTENAVESIDALEEFLV